MGGVAGVTPSVPLKRDDAVLLAPVAGHPHPIPAIPHPLGLHPHGMAGGRDVCRVAVVMVTRPGRGEALVNAEHAGTAIRMGAEHARPGTIDAEHARPRGPAGERRHRRDHECGHQESESGDSFHLRTSFV